MGCMVVVGLLILVVVGGGLLTASVWGILTGEVGFGVIGLVVFALNAVVMVVGLREELSRRRCLLVPRR